VLFEILNYHQRLNRLQQLHVVPKAVSDTDTAEVAFYLLNGGLSFRNSLTIGEPGLSFLSDVARTSAQVPTLTLDSFCRAEGLAPDVVKIDVEGAELMVLHGSAEMLREHHPVLIVSVHPSWLPPSQSAEQIFDFLAGYGYQIRESHEGMPTAISSVTTCSRHNAPVQ
jgi:FkbM family methyltransferase